MTYSRPQTLCMFLLAFFSCNGKVLTGQLGSEGTAGGTASGGPGSGSGQAGGLDCTVTDVGRVTIHRINRPEYNNTVAEILGDVSQPATDFPADDFGSGFSNLADVLSTAPVLVEKYDASAKALAETIVQKESAAGQMLTLQAEDAAHSTGAAAGTFWNLYSNGTVSGSLNLNSTGQYLFKIRAYQQAAGTEAAKMSLKIDGKSVAEFSVTALQAAPAIYTAMGNYTAGVHRYEVEFLNDFFAAPDDRNLLVDYLEVQKPGGTVSPGEAKVMVCDVGTGVDCMRTILTRFGRKAFRRPVTSAELARYETVFTTWRTEGETPQAALAASLHSMLLSPDFLFRVELDADPASLSAHALNDFELAARLSYFLWSSTPDDALGAAADNGTLHSPEVLEAQTRRMLADAKAQSLVSIFAGQWLGSVAFEEAAPSASVFPGITASLKKAMRQETEKFFEYHLKQDVSALGLLNSDFTFANAELAAHSGVAPPSGTELVKVALNGKTERGSLLGQSGILMRTSMPTRTSPVKRGAWVLDTLLCSPPPPPPAGVEALDKPDMPTENLTVRERIEAHRSKPQCSGCHALMDPIGFGLESFDGVGRFRTKDLSGRDIDASGKLTDGTKFIGPTELTKILKDDARFPFCMGEKLFTYGLGRTPAPLQSPQHASDQCQLEQLAKEFKVKNYNLKDLLVALVKSPTFTQRRGETP
jgi:Protein of unknown function (DUF1592)/Protein of unknown function (DUF1588)/Protein of unknown function (DUF1595)/Protein of unknown function (DUF1587)/Protein of unknown function (DUF1585)/Ca-dependent carbohydrate-binding module xylan-binding